MGLTKRPLYKAPRRAARKKGVIGKIAPLACPDASQPEVVSALAMICDDLQIRVGRGGEYDTLRDEYAVVAKVLDGSYQAGRWTGKVRDVKIPGLSVALAVLYARALAVGSITAMSRATAGDAAGALAALRAAGFERYDRPMTWASA